MEWTKATLVFLVFLSFTAQCKAATKLSTCQKAYFMLRQCASEMFDSQNVGPQCCELLAAFDIRDCLKTDSRLQAFATKSPKTLSPLRSVCAQGVPSTPAATDAATTKKNDKALEEATKGVSQARRGDTSMLKEVMAIAEAVIASGTETRTVTVDFEFEGNPRDVESTVAAVASIAKRASQTTNMLLEEISVELEGQRSSGLCTCMGAEMPEDADDAASNWRAYLRFNYLTARLQLCKLVCEHQKLVLGALFVHLVALACYLLYLAVRPGKESTAETTLPRHGSFEKNTLAQFIAKSQDPEWTQPLLGDEEEGMSP